MPKLTLSFISAFNERVEPLMKGIVQAEAIEIVPTYSHPSETFLRQLKNQEFPVGEMSMSSYLIARERGLDMIALPVFPSRRLFHTELSYHTDSGIRTPEDIIGKRIGVSEYQQTAALWQRGILDHDFGEGLPARISLYFGAGQTAISLSRNPCNWAVERNTRSKPDVSESYMRSK